MCLFFFFKQKPAYEMRISDWSSDVCSSDLLRRRSAILTVIASLGVALMLRAVVQVGWGVDSQSYVGRIARPETYLGIRVKDREIWTLVATAGLVVALQLFLGFTRWGKAMRSLSANPALAPRSEEHTSELKSHISSSYADICLTQY